MRETTASSGPRDRVEMSRRRALIGVAAGVGTLAFAGTGHAFADGGVHTGPVAPVGTVAQRYLDRMRLSQRIGQIFMVGTPATSVDATTLAYIATFHVGNVILTGRSYSGIATPQAVVRRMQAHATHSATAGVPLLVATDQEGGYVQVLQGSGISRMPTALTQGTWSDAHLRGDARTWGGQLREVGVNVNLAPVLDTVPSAAWASTNPPIGVYRREYGYTPTVTAAKGTAFEQGMHEAGVQTTIKHFPGLGMVHANTDTSEGVTDYWETTHSSYLAPFRAGIAAGTGFVMMSSAIYQKIDARYPACFCPDIVTGLLQQDLGFRGVVMSDDLGAARQLSPWQAGWRPVDFLGSGGHLVLTVTPSVVPTMYHELYDLASNNPRVRAHVDRAALRVLLAKELMGLIR